jgi:hypothetical protein
MTDNVVFQEEDRGAMKFTRLTPEDFAKSLTTFLESIPDDPDNRADAIIDMLRRQDSEMVSRLFGITPIPANEIAKYKLHEGDMVIAAMARRVLAQEIVNAMGMEFAADSSDFREAVDSAGLVARVQNFGHYMRETWQQKNDEIIKTIKSGLDSSRIQRVVLPGAMGGSAVGVAVVNMLLANLGYQSELVLLPHYPDPTRPLRSTDLIALYSYSGNTEELLLWTDMIEAAGTQVVGFSTGGRLQQICQEKKYPFIEIPGKSFNLAQPREHLPVAICLLITTLAAAGLVWKEENGKRVLFDHDEWYPRLEATSRKLTELADTTYNVELPCEENVAKQAALFLNWGTTDPDKVSNLADTRDPVFWASSFYEAIARRMENQFGECVEHPASAKIMPEDLHNEQEAYVEQWLEHVWRVGEAAGSPQQPYNNVFLRFRGPLDGRLDKRVDKVFNEFLAGAPRMTFTIKDYGPDYPMLGELEAILFADLTRAYASILRGVTPHYVHSMTYNKHYMASIPGGPGSTGKY